MVTADVLDDAHVLLLHTVSPAACLRLQMLLGVRQCVQMFSPPAGAGLPLELVQPRLLLAAAGEARAEGPGAGLLPGQAAGLPQ